MLFRSNDTATTEIYTLSLHDALPILMDLQAKLSRKKNEALIGTMQRVMIDGTDLETNRISGRTQAHAPEVDGLVFIDDFDRLTDSNQPEPGAMTDVRITTAFDYDLVGEITHG